MTSAYERRREAADERYRESLAWAIRQATGDPERIYWESLDREFDRNLRSIVNAIGRQATA